MKPQRFVAIDATEIANYFEDDRLLRAKPWALQLRTLRVLRGMTQWAQNAGEEKADRLGEGVLLFGFGLAGAVVAVVTLGLANQRKERNGRAT